MRSTLAAGFLAAVIGLFPGLALAGEHRMSADELRDIARRELLWCEEYNATTDDCDVVSLIRLMPDGRLAETSTLLLQDEPRLQVFIADVDQIEGDRICSKVEARRARFSFTLDGAPLAEDASMGLRLLFLAQLADMEGKTMCQAFFRGDDPNVVREEITLDGQRQTDLESTYHLREGNSDLKLRPQLPPDEESNRTTL
jgi:hypothetical protein